MQDDDNCVVCLESIGDNRVQNPKLFACGHADKVDQSCLQGIIKAKVTPTCPWCRQPLSFNHCTNPFDKPLGATGAYMEVSALDMPAPSAGPSTEDSSDGRQGLKALLYGFLIFAVTFLIFYVPVLLICNLV